ncbi:MAG TPA: c-type cytochrome [Kofleriaceae bacterium]|nr:c-type cytochrome [Kofleriaceae bacterium]
MRRLASLCAGLAVAACSGGGPGSSDPLEFPEVPGGKTDVFGRSLVGVPAPYEPDPALTAPGAAEALEADVRLRRDAAWTTVYKVLEPVPLLGLAEVIEDHPEVSWPEENVPRVPRWETWYGVEDIKRMFQHLYEGLGLEGRQARAPFAAGALAEAEVWNAGAAARSDRWPLERYLDHVRALGECPEGTPAEECAPALESLLGGAVTGTTRILYSPGTARHLLNDYAGAVRCLEALDSLSLEAEPPAADNFTACFAEELPADAVLIKAQWVRADFEPELPAFDTDADAMQRRLEGSATWSEEGDRKVDPSAGDIYTIRLRDGSVFRLAGMHIMTKELRHWQWITLWWSDLPGDDFGADRPARFADLPPVWSRYKMCTVTWFDERDPELGQRYQELPSLAAALDATGGAPGEPSWCSNPYIEHGRANAGTNCIGCHQHGGSQVAHDKDGDGGLDPFDLDAVIHDEVRFPAIGRVQIRETFPADYMYSFNRVDDVSHVFAQEMDFQGGVDKALEARVTAVLEGAGDAASGAALFAGTCAACHGPDGHGGEVAPDLRERVPSREDAALVRTLLTGKGGMPSWADRFDDRGFADILAFLRQQFGGPVAP